MQTDYEDDETDPYEPEDLESIISALKSGIAFQHLHDLELCSYDIDDADLSRLLSALGGAICSSHMISLVLGDSSLCSVSMATFAELLDKNAFPKLQSLELKLRCIDERGPELLVQGLLAPACLTRLTQFKMCYYHMGDKEIAALANVIRAGRFDELESLFLYWGRGVTNTGLRELASVIDTHGLPMLRTFEVSTLSSLWGRPSQTRARASGRWHLLLS